MNVEILQVGHPTLRWPGNKHVMIRSVLVPIWSCSGRLSGLCTATKSARCTQAILHKPRDRLWSKGIEAHSIESCAEVAFNDFQRRVSDKLHWLNFYSCAWVHCQWEWFRAAVTTNLQMKLLFWESVTDITVFSLDGGCLHRRINSEPEAAPRTRKCGNHGFCVIMFTLPGWWSCRI